MRMLGWILRVEPFYVLLLSIPIFLPERLIPLRFHAWLLAGVMLFVILRVTQAAIKSTDVETSPLFWPSTLLLACCFVGMLVSPLPAASVIVAGYLICSIAAHIALYQAWWLQSEPVRFVLCAILLVSLFSFVAPALVLWKPEFRLFELPLYRWLGKGLLAEYNIFGETIHANVLAGVLVPFILLLLPLVRWRIVAVVTSLRGGNRVTLSKNLALVIFLSSILAYWVLLLLLTQSRGAYLGFGVGSCLLLVIFYPILVRMVIGLALLAVAGLGLLGVARPSLFLGMESALGGGEFRWDIWSNAAYALSDTPFTGIGIGMYQSVIPVMYPFAYVDGRLAEHAHNMFLQIGLDTGILGLVSFLAILLLCATMLRSLLKVNTHSPSWFLSAGTAAAICSVVIHGMLDAVVWGTKISFVPWFFFTLLSLLFHQHKRDEIAQVA